MDNASDIKGAVKFADGSQCAHYLTCSADKPLQREVKVQTGAYISTNGVGTIHQIVEDLSDKVSTFYIAY